MTVTPMIHRWETPPPPPKSTTNRARTLDRRSQPWTEVAITLQQRPGEWAVIGVADGPSRVGYLAWAIRRGAQPGFEPVGDYDAVSRRTPDGRWALYAVYVGGDQTT